MAARDLAAFRLRHVYFALDFHGHRKDDPRADNAMSLLIGLASASAWVPRRHVVAPPDNKGEFP